MIAITQSLREESHSQPQSLLIFSHALVHSVIVSFIAAWTSSIVEFSLGILAVLLKQIMDK